MLALCDTVRYDLSAQPTKEDHEEDIRRCRSCNRFSRRPARKLPVSHTSARSL